MGRPLRTAALVAIVVVVALGYARISQEKGFALPNGTAVPPLTLPSLSGGEVNLSSYRGKVVVLNFWATWCPPCVAEMPSLQRLHRSLAPEGLAVVTVSTDSDEETLREFVSDHDLTLPVLLDPGGRTAASVYLVTGYPETFIVDPEGLLLHHSTGPAEWDTPEALAHLRALLEPTVASP